MKEKDKRPKLAKDPFRLVSALEASRLKDNTPALSTRREASSVYTDFLHLNPEQIGAISSLYASGQIEEHKFER